MRRVRVLADGGELVAEVSTCGGVEVLEVHRVLPDGRRAPGGLLLRRADFSALGELLDQAERDLARRWQ